ncbi:MAG: hypothetical protein WBA23_01905 [Tunicatimonas sp.]|uniref:AAA family ATPase n=1 Tax=Tunicatimonas sp. TaxID=1940096 RepID=UPI003C76D2FE
MKSLDYGKNYKYAHDYDQKFVVQEFLPDALSKTIFYQPGHNARENELRKRLKQLWGNHYEY